MRISLGTLGGLLGVLLFAMAPIGCSGGGGGGGGATTPPVIQITISNLPTEIALGDELVLEALGTYADGTEAIVTDGVEWSTSDPTVADIVDGVLTALRAGSVEIQVRTTTAESQVYVITVEAPRLVAIELTVPVVELAVGLSTPLSAVGVYSDGGRLDLTSDVEWVLSDSVPATLVGNTLLSVAPGATVLTATFEDVTSDGVDITLTPAALVELTLAEPAVSAVALGQSASFSVNGLYTDGSVADLTQDVAWLLGGEGSGAIDGGTFLPASAGEVTVQAELVGVLSNVQTIEVLPAQVVSLVLSEPETDEIVAGRSTLLVATATYTDGTTDDLTDVVEWLSSDLAVATVAAGVVEGVAPGSVDIIAALGDVATNAVAIEVLPAVVETLSITDPGAEPIPVGMTRTVTVTGTYSDGTVADVTGDVAWRISGSGGVAVSAEGVITATDVGLIVLEAEIDSVVSGRTFLEVVPAVVTSLLIEEPPSTTLIAGQLIALSATAIYSDGATADVSDDVDWITEGDTAVLISSRGIVIAQAAGTVSVRVEWRGNASPPLVFTVLPPILVDLNVQGSSGMAGGRTQQLIANGAYSDGSQQDVTLDVEWESTNPAVASVDSSGFLTAVGVGIAFVRAELDGELSGPFVVVVGPPELDSIVLTSPAPSVVAGLSMAITATGTYSNGDTVDLTSAVDWSSSDETVATILAGGLLQSSNAGTTTLLAKFDGVVSESLSITVDAPLLESLAIGFDAAPLPAGLTRPASAIGTYTDGTSFDITDEVTWSVSDPSVASVSADGTVTAIAIGGFLLEAELDGVIAPTVAATVSAPLLEEITIVAPLTAVATGLSTTFVATGRYSDGSEAILTPNWSSTDPAVLAIDATGVASALAEGTATVTATLDDITSSGVEVTVLPAALESIELTLGADSVAAGTPVAASAIGSYSDGSTSALPVGAVSWTSSDASLATIDNGTITTLAAGDVEFTASLAGVTSPPVVLEILAPMLESLTIELPANPAIAAGLETTLVAIGGYSDGTDVDVSALATWSSSDETIATVAAGVVSGVAAGSVTISATLDGVVATAVELEVVDAELVSLTIVGDATVPVGFDLPLTVEGVFTDGTVSTLTTSVLWSVDDASTATVASDGTVTGVSVGEVNVTATLGAVASVPFAIEVLPEVLVSLAITPENPDPVPAGESITFSATGSYSDGSQRNVTALAAWQSNTPGLTSISAGEVTTFAAGTVTLTASLDGIDSPTVTLEVLPAVVVAVELDVVGSTTTPAGVDVELSVSATYSDGTTQDHTADALYTVSDPGLATIVAGTLTPLATGSVEVTATVDGIASDAVVITITDPLLDALTLSTSTPTIAAGLTGELSLVATYSDGSELAVATDAPGVGWVVDDPETLIVKDGVPTALVSGTVSVFGILDGVSSNAITLQVTAPLLAALAIEGAETAAPLGESLDFTVVGTYTDGSTADVTALAAWSSSIPTIASVVGGTVTTLAEGTTAIAADLAGVSAPTVDVTVLPPVLVSLTLASEESSVVAGRTIGLDLTATLSDGSTVVPSEPAFWSAVPSNVASVADAIVTGTSTGDVVINASIGGVTSNSVVITVLPPVLESLTLAAPPSAQVVAGFPLALSVSGSYSDGSENDVTTLASWTTNDPTIGTVSNGVLAPQLAGELQIFATLDGIDSNSVDVEVLPPVIDSLEVTPASPGSIFIGQTTVLSAQATFSNQTEGDVTSTVLWEVSDASVASVAAGVVTGLTAGSVDIRVVSDGVVSPWVSVTVAEAALVTLAIDAPGVTEVIAGFTVDLTLHGTYEDGSERTLTADATWLSSAPTIATVTSGALEGGRVAALAAGDVEIRATLDGVTSPVVSLSVLPPILTELAISAPGATALPSGETIDLVAMGTYSDGNTTDVTVAATWSSSAPTVATVDAFGIVSTLDPGTATIEAELDGITSGSISVEVLPAALVSLSITPAAPGDVIEGETRQLTVTGNFTDGSTSDLTQSAVWESDDATVATVGAGTVLAIAEGSAQIEASVGTTRSDPVTVTVVPPTLLSLEVAEPTTLDIAAGFVANVTVTGTYDVGPAVDLTETVTWSSSDSLVATVDPDGTVRALAEGTAEVRAELDGVLSNVVTVQVGPPLLLSVVIPTPASDRVVAGFSVQLSAIGEYSDGSLVDLSGDVTWVSSAASVASVDTQGTLLALSAGQTTIHAEFLGEMSNSIQFQVFPPVLVELTMETPAELSLAVGQSAKLETMGTFSDGSMATLTDLSVWTSSDPTVLSVVPGGVITALAAGEATISARFDTLEADPVLFEITLPVLDVLAISSTRTELALGESTTFDATGTYSDGAVLDETATVTWLSSDPGVATVDATGALTTWGEGTTTITATRDGIDSNAVVIDVTAPIVTSLVVTPVAPESVAAGRSLALNAFASYSDGTGLDVSNVVLWSVSDSSVATVVDGLVTTLVTGSVDVQATLDGFVSNIVSVNVLPAELETVTVQPNGAGPYPVGITVPFTALGAYSDGSELDLTASAVWSSAAPAIATIDGAGVMSGVAEGVTTITATQDGVASAPFAVTIVPEILTALSISTSVNALPLGSTASLVATGTFSDGSTGDLTGSVEWVFLPGGAASVAPDGTLTTLAEGVLTIEARLDGIASPLATITIQPAELVSLEIERNETGPIVAGVATTFRATGTYTDSTTIDHTGDVAWSTTDATLATIGTTGALDPLRDGAGSVLATLDGISADPFAITIRPAELVELTINPVTPAPVAAGGTIALTVEGRYTDDSVVELTASTLWSTSQPTVAVVAAGGTVTTLTEGTTEIRAELDGVISAPVTVQVLPADLTTLTLTATESSTPAGFTIDLTVVGAYTDGTEQTLTDQMTWFTSDGMIATVGATGVLNTLESGTVNVQAQFDGVASNALTIEVLPAVWVSVEIVSGPTTIVAGLTGDYRADGTKSDGSVEDATDAVVWSSSNLAVGTIDATGQATALAEGAFAVQATLDGILAPSRTVTVTPAELTTLAISTPEGNSAPAGRTLTVAVIGTYTDLSTADLTADATWISSDPTILTIDAGVISAITIGSATVTAELDGVTSPARSIDVLAPVLTDVEIVSAPSSLPIGFDAPLTAEGIYSDGSRVDDTARVTFLSSDLSVLTVAGSQLTAVGEGTAEVRASLEGIESAPVSVTVTAEVLLSMALSGAPAEAIPAGRDALLTATGSFSDASDRDVTADAVWTTSNAAVATVVAGRVVGVAPGDATITATIGDVTDSLVISVGPALLTALSIADPIDANVIAGFDLALAATGAFSDGSTLDQSSVVTWISSDATRATVASDGTVTAHAVGPVTISASAVNAEGETIVSNDIALTVLPPIVVSVAIDTPATTEVIAGFTLPLSATATYSDASTEDVSDSGVWSVSDPAVASILGTGLLSALAEGTVEVGFELGADSAVALPITVLAPIATSISIPTPATTELPLGIGELLTTHVALSDGSTEDRTASATWISDNPAVLTVVGGVVTPVAVGTALVTAEADGFTSNAIAFTVLPARLDALTITGDVDPLPLGRSTTLIVTGSYSDGSTVDVTALATWSTSDPLIATVAAGVVTTVAPGSVTIDAELDGVTASAVSLEVLPAVLETLAVDPATTQSIPLGLTATLTATGSYSDGSVVDLSATVNWSSAVESVATVAAGLVATVGEGTTSIVADLDGVISPTVTVNVIAPILLTLEISDPTTTTLPEGRSESLLALGTFSDGAVLSLTDEVAWTTTDPTIATVNTGVVTGASVGTASINITYDGFTDGPVEFTITPAVLEGVTIPHGATTTVPVGREYTFSLIGAYSDGSNSAVTTGVTWISSNPAVATIVDGVLTAVAEGTVSISATIDGFASNSVTVTVTPAVLESLALTPSPPAAIAAGRTTTFVAEGGYSDGSLRDVTADAAWNSLSPSVATVVNGEVTTFLEGSSRIEATLDGLTAGVDLSVLAPVLDTLTISTPESTIVPAGLSLPLPLLGTYSDGSTASLVGSATWISSAPAVATVSAGVVEGVAIGTVQIRAEIGAVVSNSVTLQVSAATLQSVSMVPVGTTAAAGETLSWTATGDYSDGSSGDITSTALWVSSDPAVASVAEGTITALAVGTTEIHVELYGVSSAAVTVTVTPAAVTSVELFATPLTVGVGRSRDITATAHYSDGTSLDRTLDAIWTASDPARGTISAGVLTGVGIGDVDVTAEIDGVLSAPLTISVIDSVLESLVVTGVGATDLTIGDQLFLTATATYNDGGTEDVTDLVDWSSSNATVASVVAGQLDALERGSCYVTATLAGTTSALQLVVVLESGDPDIVPVITPSIHESTMAPLRVFVDCVSSTYLGEVIDGYGTGRDYRDFKIAWDFGNPGNEYNVQAGGNMCASHVYEMADDEAPREVAIILTLTDPDTGNSSSVSHRFTLNPFDGTTYYFSADGDDELGDGSIDSPWQSIPKAASEVRAHTGGAIRILWRRGDTFPVFLQETFTAISGDPLIVFAAYGEGPMPFVDAADLLDSSGFSPNIFRLAGACHNWVFQDMRFFMKGHPILGPGQGDVWDCNASISQQTGTQNLLVQRCIVKGSATPLSTFGDAFDYELQEAQFKDITMVDNEFRDASTHILFIGSERLAVMGNILKGNGREHLLRFWYIGRGVIINNTAEDMSVDQSQGRVRATMRILSIPRRDYADILPTRHVIVANNHFQMGSNNQCFDIAPGHDDIDTNGHTQHIIFEKNTLFPSLTAPYPGQSYFDLVADNITVRNNVIHGSADLDNLNVVRCIDYFSASNGFIDAPKPHNIWVYGNTVYHPNIDGNRFRMVHVVTRDGGTGFAAATDEFTGNLIVRNNAVVLGPGATKDSSFIGVDSPENSMVADGQIISDHNVYYNPNPQADVWLDSTPEQESNNTLAEWNANYTQPDGTPQEVGSDTFDVGLVSPDLGSQVLTVTSTVGFNVGDHVWGLNSGASGIVDAIGADTLTLRAVWSGRPFPGAGADNLDTGVDLNLYNLWTDATTDVTDATVADWTEDFSLVPDSPGIGFGVVERRMFEDFYGNPRPGSFGTTGTPSVGAIEPVEEE